MANKRTNTKRRSDRGTIGSTTHHIAIEEPAEDRRIAGRNLDMLMGVEVNVSVSFGRTRLTLVDVLKLASSSIVELNRLASGPVAVMVNGTVVAHGDVVLVDGDPIE